MATGSRLFQRLVARRASAAQADEPLRLEPVFDLAVVERVARKDKVPPQWAGLKFFNVFGPNEYHKGEMIKSRGQALRRRQGGRQSGCSSRTARSSPTANRSVIPSTWTMPSPSSAGCWRRLRYRASTTSAPAGAQLSRPDDRDARGARRQARDQICSGVHFRSATAAVFHPGGDNEVCTTRGIMLTSPCCSRRCSAT